MIARAAFGAITGAILGLLLDPLLSALPTVPILTEFIESFASEVLMVGLAAAGAVASSRIHRLDHFIAAYLLRAAVIASVLLAGSLWLNAGTPATMWAFITVAITTAVGMLILAFCGWVVQNSMQGFTPDQAREAADRRDREAKHIAEEAIARGDPTLAVGIYGLDLAGRVGQAYAMGCLGLVLLPTTAGAILLAATLNAHFLYGVPWFWAFVTGAIIAVAGLGALGVSDEVGKAHAHHVPLGEKYEELMPRRDIDPPGQ